MCFYLAYRYVLPVVIVVIVLFLFSLSRTESVRNGWTLALLFFGLSVAFLLPMKPNPFDADKLAYEQSKTALTKINNLTADNFLLGESLAENVTDKTIQETEKQLPLVNKRKRKKAKKQIQQAWNLWHIQQAELFFRDNLGWNMDSSFNYPEKDKINPESIPNAKRMLEQLEDSHSKKELEKFLEQCEEVIAQP